MSNIDDEIRKAIEQGKFSNLPGEGKPLRLKENPWENPEWRMAYHLLQANGFTLPWIERRQAIEQALEEARHQLYLAWQYHQSADAVSGERHWQRALQAFESQIEAINREIRNYNLSVPLDRFQMQWVQIKREVDRLTAPSLSDTL